VDKADAARKTAQAIPFSDFVVESRSRVEVPRILEQLKKISALKIDDFILSSGSKLENAVKEMFSVIKDLEGHLRDVLTLNASLQEETRDAKKTTDRLQQDRDAAVQRAAAFDRDMPRVQDLEKRLEMTIGEVERFRMLYRQEQQKAEKAEASQQAVASAAAKVKEERDDAYREIVVMEDKLKSFDRASR